MDGKRRGAATEFSRPFRAKPRSCGLLSPVLRLKIRPPGAVSRIPTIVLERELTSLLVEYGYSLLTLAENVVLTAGMAPVEVREILETVKKTGRRMKSEHSAVSSEGVASSQVTRAGQTGESSKTGK